MNESAVRVRHTIGRPVDSNDSIPRKCLVSRDKLKAEGALEEVKIIIGWCFDTRHLLLSLPDHKFKAWDKTITKMLKDKSTCEDDLETLIGRLTHVTMFLPSLLHFLSRL